jgi:hypothetical protein
MIIHIGIDIGGSLIPSFKYMIIQTLELALISLSISGIWHWSKLNANLPSPHFMQTFFFETRGGVEKTPEFPLQKRGRYKFHKDPSITRPKKPRI